MSRRLERQSILLTGGGSGIGRAVALAYVHHGATVTVVERDRDNARELIEATGGEIDVVVGDATDAAVLAGAVERASGNSGLDNLTCCVGVFDYYANLRTLSAAQLSSAAEEIYRVNVLGTLTAIHAGLGALQDARGSVTLTLSESAFHPVGGGVLYGSSKWALRGVLVPPRRGPCARHPSQRGGPGGPAGTRFGGLAALDQTRPATVDGRDERITSGTLLRATPRPEDHAGAYVYLADREAAPPDHGRRHQHRRRAAAVKRPTPIPYWIAGRSRSGTDVLDVVSPHDGGLAGRTTLPTDDDVEAAVWPPPAPRPPRGHPGASGPRR